jgi:hypothetical protein
MAGESNKKLTIPKVIDTQSICHNVINMGRYNFYNESPNDFDFTDEDPCDFTDERPDLNAEFSKIDHFDFYYDLKELQKHAAPLCRTMVSFLISSHHHHKGGVTSSVILSSYVMMT